MLWDFLMMGLLDVREGEGSWSESEGPIPSPNEFDLLLLARIFVGVISSSDPCIEPVNEGCIAGLPAIIHTR